jgi:hypothetical protein
MFDNKHFLQIKGNAMETKVAPTYVTLVLGFLEANYLKTYISFLETSMYNL